MGKSMGTPAANWKPSKLVRQGRSMSLPTKLSGRNRTMASSTHHEYVRVGSMAKSLRAIRTDQSRGKRVRQPRSALTGILKDGIFSTIAQIGWYSTDDRLGPFAWIHTGKNPLFSNAASVMGLLVLHAGSSQFDWHDRYAEPSPPVLSKQSIRLWKRAIGPG